LHATLPPQPHTLSLHDALPIFPRRVPLHHETVEHRLVDPRGHCDMRLHLTDRTTLQRLPVHIPDYRTDPERVRHRLLDDSGPFRFAGHCGTAPGLAHVVDVLVVDEHDPPRLVSVAHLPLRKRLSANLVHRPLVERRRVERYHLRRRIWTPLRERLIRVRLRRQVGYTSSQRRLVQAG